MKIIAIIPARGGSKGIPNKNRLPILGKPLINYTVEVAKEASCLDEVWVTSDNDEILDCIEDFDKLRIHKRSKNLALDSSPIIDTILCILNLYESESRPDAIMLLQPTSPIRDVKNIEESVSILRKRKEINSIISVCAMDDVHPARMYWSSDNILKPIMPEFEATRRQDIPKAMYRSGSIYIARVEELIKTKSLMCKPSFGYEMPEEMLLNIDNQRDMVIAPALIKAWRDQELI